MEEQNNNNLKILFDGLKSNYDTITNADNTLDGKAGTLMGIEIAFGISYFTFFINSLTGVSTLGLTFLVVSIALLLIVNWPRTYSAFSINAKDKPEYLTKMEKELLVQLISDGQNALNKNNKKLRFKTALYQAALVLLIISSLLLIAKDTNIWPTTNQVYRSSQLSHHHRLFQPRRPNLNSHPQHP